MANKFRKETIKEFNFNCDTSLHEKMTFSESLENIENANNNYFYISMSEKDIFEALETEKDIVCQLDLELILITDLGIFIALQP